MTIVKIMIIFNKDNCMVVAMAAILLSIITVGIAVTLFTNC